MTFIHIGPSTWAPVSPMPDRFPRFVQVPRSELLPSRVIWASREART
ncbi:hypothetical protein NKG94_15545 [Micromonospora sp. M12]